MFEADPSKEKKKPKEGENVVEEPAADIPSLLELKQIYYQLMIRYIWLCFKCGFCVKLFSLDLMIVLHPLRYQAFSSFMQTQIGF